MKLFKIKRKLRKNEQITITKEEIEMVESMVNDMILIPNTSKKM